MAPALTAFAASLLPAQVMMLQVFPDPLPVELVALGVFVVACAVVGLRVNAVRGVSVA